MIGALDAPRCPDCGTAAALALVEVADQCALTHRAAMWRCPGCGATLNRLEGRWRSARADSASNAEIANDRIADA